MLDELSRDEIEEPYRVTVINAPYEFSKRLLNYDGYVFGPDCIMGDSINGTCYSSSKGDIISKLPNFSLAQLQVVNDYARRNIIIYIPQRRFKIKDYKELVAQKFEKKIADIVGDKLDAQDINKIILKAGIDDVASSSIQTIHDPFEYGKEMIKKDDEKIENIFGDIKVGEEKSIYSKRDDRQRKVVTTKPNFSIGKIQVGKVNLYDFFEDKKEETILKIYIPSREYEEKDYEELMHNKKKNYLLEAIKQQTNTKLTLEQLKQVDEMCDRFDIGDKIVISTSPYEYADMLQPLDVSVEYLAGDTKKEEFTSTIINFSLGIPQISKMQKPIDVATAYWGRRREYIEQYCIYMPIGDCIQGMTYEQLLILDSELLKARDCIDMYKGEEKEKSFRGAYNAISNIKRQFLGKDIGEK